MVHEDGLISSTTISRISFAVIVHRNNNVDIIDSEPTTEDSVSVQTLANVQTLEPSSRLKGG